MQDSSRGVLLAKAQMTGPLTFNQVRERNLAREELKKTLSPADRAELGDRFKAERAKAKVVAKRDELVDAIVVEVEAALAANPKRPRAHVIQQTLAQPEVQQIRRKIMALAGNAAADVSASYIAHEMEALRNRVDLAVPVAKAAREAMTPAVVAIIKAAADAPPGLERATATQVAVDAVLESELLPALEFLGRTGSKSAYADAVTVLPGWMPLHSKLSVEASTGRMPAALMAGHERRTELVAGLVDKAREVQASTTERRVPGREALRQAIAKSGDPYATSGAHDDPRGLVLRGCWRLGVLPRGWGGPSPPGVS